MPNWMQFIWAHTKQVSPLLDFSYVVLNYVYDVFLTVL